MLFILFCALALFKGKFLALIDMFWFFLHGHMNSHENSDVSMKGSKLSEQPAGAKVPQVKQMLLLAND